MVFANNRAAASYPLTLLILLLPTLVFAAYASVDQLIRLFPDDAFYYLQTAFNAAHGGLISFDGISKTNGFHPLQFLLCFLLAKISDKEILLRYSVIESVVLVALAALILAEYFFRDCAYKIKLVAITVLACPIWYLYIWLDAGMEMGLVLLFGVWFYCAWQRAAQQSFTSLRENCWIAISGAILLLARLDISISISLFAIAYLGYVSKSQRLVLYVFVPGACAALFLMPYLAWNWLEFGHLVPVSGVVKAGAVHDLQANWRALTAGTLIGGLLVLLPLIVASIALLFAAVPKPALSSFILLILSVCIYYGYVFFNAKQVFRWYLAYPLVLQCVSLAFLLHKVVAEPKLGALVNRYRTLLGLLFLAVGVHTIFYYWACRLDTTSLHLKQIAQDLNARLTPDDIVGTYDAGTIGYFTNARIVNLDGLANSYEYYEFYLRPDRVADYLNKIGATYYLARKNVSSNTPFEREPAPQWISSYQIPGQFELDLYRLSR